ncbi:Serine/threonine-protein kinase ppk30 [Cladobotryum mycophilum]|uniref:non-specific serine/threonine protein kinase n=1 Tax=Cladobotryum mycophilum TaxID=491253 RepID=A0ABR0S9Z4_9HYPO
MASYGHRMAPQAVPKHHPQAGYGAPMAPPAAVPPAGTFVPGTKIQVGNHKVQIQKYLSEGGFAHVYLVKMPKPVDGTDLAVLKRVAVPDKEALRGMRTEVETMKRLKGHRAIVTYIDSHASELQGGGYEVFLLMEYCGGGGLIDFMNTRLQHRLTEPEILNIFADIAEGVACMHYLKPALLHRDLKVENVLITTNDSSKRFKVCDFGSAAPRDRPPPPFPEMIDVYRKQPIDEKSDIWALGVLLYKLCYYTTPFEDQGQLAILNASYKYPSYPVFSDRLKKLIASMLKENMQARPNIYQVLKEACVMQGREVPVHDIYAGQNNLQTKNTESARTKEQKAQPAPVVGAVFSAPVQEQQTIPDIVPMRRGRPTPSPSAGTTTPRQSSAAGKVAEGDPFAALDSKLARKVDTDELSARFPSLDHFSLLHDQGSFNFDSAPISPALDKDMGQAITERLVDEVFSTSRNVSTHPSPTPRPQTVAPITSRPEVLSPPADANTSSSTSQPSMSRAQSIIRNNPELKEIASKTAKSGYVSSVTATEKVPEQKRKSLDKARQVPEAEKSRLAGPVGYSDQNDTKRQTSETWAAADPRSSSSSIHHRLSHGHLRSSRASIDTTRSSATDLIDLSGPPDGSTTRQRPASTTFEPSTLEFLRERENATRPPVRQSRPASRQSSYHLPLSGAETPRNNDVGLRDRDAPRSRGASGSREHSSANLNRRSDPVSGPGSKNLLAGKFGDAFKRFENNVPSGENSRSSSPQRDLAHRALTPIAGSEMTGDRSDDSDDEDHNYLTAEMRRDMERRKLEEEEARVEAAQAEYRRRIADAGSPTKSTAGAPKAGGPSRASSIQERVQNLLNEDQRPTSAPRTAQGYGKYTDTAPPSGEGQKPTLEIRRKPVIPSKPIVESPSASTSTLGGRSSTSSLPPVITKSQVKPSAPKKPVHLNSIPTGGRQTSPTKVSPSAQFERLIAMDLPGQPMLDITARERDDYIEDFAKRFPSLSTIELNHTGDAGRSR